MEGNYKDLFLTCISHDITFTQTAGLTLLPLAALGRVHFRKHDALPNYEITSKMYSKALHVAPWTRGW
jgi:hypothetical protein